MSPVPHHGSPTHSHAMRFPSVGMEVLSAMIHLLGASTLAFLLAKKITWADLSSPQALSRISWPRLLVILTIVDSCCISAGLLVNGAGMELSETVCLLGILNCIAFYATSKILIYLFLVEKVYVVWSGAVKKKRLHSPVYLVCLGVVSVYLGVAIFLVHSRISYFRDDGSCVIGLTRPASLTLLIYDLLVNVLLTSLFVWPLFTRKFITPRLRRVAVRTLWAASVALTTSCINILVLTIMHGKQLAWVCLASCGTDVVVNAAVLSWVTSKSPGKTGSPAGSRDTDDSMSSEGNIIDCGGPAPKRASAYTMRRRARSELPQPTFRARMSSGFARLFPGRRHTMIHEADTDLEHLAGAAGEISGTDTAGEGEEGEREDEDKGEDEGGVEGMYGEHEHAHSRRSALSQPRRAYASMLRLKRSEASLRNHLNDSQVQIQVFQETQTIVDETPLHDYPRLKKRRY
ncbi:hypothetical protein C8Q77DRAFT_1063723 [Trametes polyzona]|nr:hypothetical protein C8Q77DRAFT_1063723 [Trametes polyzona]